MARISILSTDEINALYSIPILIDEERLWLFELDDDDTEYLNNLKTVAEKINYILQLGYYRAVNCFFKFSFQKVRDDVNFIMERYFPNSAFPKKQIARHQHYDNRTQICRKFELREADEASIEPLTLEAKRLAKLHVLPKFVFTGLVSYCQQHNIIKPAYSKLQDIVSEALKTEQNRLTKVIYSKIDLVTRSRLDRLLENDDLLYNLTLLKKEQKDFKTKEIKHTVQKQQLIIDIYTQSQGIMKSLGISEQNIIYYAELAEFYTIQKLRDLKLRNLARLYLLCYVQMRLRKINDQLVDSLVHKMMKYVKLGDDYQRAKIDAVEAVDNKLRMQACEVMQVNVNEQVPDISVREKVFEIVPKTEYQQFLTEFKKPNFDREFYRWEMYGKLGRKLKRNIRPIFTAVEFSCDNEALMEAVNFLKTHIAGNHPFKSYQMNDIPLTFFPKTHLRFLLNQPVQKEQQNIGVIDGDRYEFMVYLQLQKSIHGIGTHIKDSISYRALEDELIELEDWEKNKQQILEKLNMPTLSNNIVDILDEFEESIESQYRYVNQRINDGSNTSVKLKFNKKNEFTHWTLPYEPMESGINNIFFSSLPTFNIADLTKSVNDETDYGKSFTHLQPRYAKLKPEMEVIDACIIANATGTEIQKMIDISDIDGQSLKRTNDNFIRFQTLRIASDTIINKTAKLPIFQKYTLSDYGVHASVDGQKLFTRYNTIKSRHSKKYFGLRKGVVIITLSANHLPICIKVIGANEHESHFLLDLVESNTSDVDIKAVSGDMHSINRVNFALMHMFGYQFMPRFTQVPNKS